MIYKWIEKWFINELKNDLLMNEKWIHIIEWKEVIKEIKK